jgi:hypothetical protein
LHRTSRIREQLVERVIIDATMESETIKHLSPIGIPLDFRSALIRDGPNDVEVNVFTSHQEI